MVATPIRTAKGTPVAVKASGTALTINSFFIAEGATLVACLGYDNSQGAPVSVKFGNRDLKERIKQANVGTGFTSAIWTAPYIRHSNTRSLTATWSSAIGARAMTATQISEVGRVDVSSSAQQDATTSPATGAAVTTTAADTLHIAAFMVNGPTNDTPATANLGHTIGQRVGTVGIPPISNITLQETYEILAATGDCRASLNLTTARDCAACIIAFKASQTYTIVDAFEIFGVADNDAYHVRLVVESETTNDTFHVRIDPIIFDALTDEEVTERVVKACSWHAEHMILGEMDMQNPDSTRATRLATFINDEIVI